MIWVPASTRVTKESSGKALGPCGEPPCPKAASLLSELGGGQGAPVEAHHAPVPIPGAGGLRGRARGDQPLIEQLHRGEAEFGPRLGDGGFAGDIDLHRQIHHLAQILLHAAEHLAAGVVHKETEGDDIIDEKVGGQGAATLTRFAGLFQDLFDHLHRNHLGKNREGVDAGEMRKRERCRCGSHVSKLHSGGLLVYPE